MGTRIAIILFAAITLPACQTKTLSEMSYSELKAAEAQAAQSCRAQGIGPNSPELTACIRQEVGREDAAYRERTRRYLMWRAVNG